MTTTIDTTTDARTWADTMLRPGASCILDVETTSLDGAIIEIAAIDTHDGAVLCDTLVNPAGIPISDSARAVHGISDADVQSSPTWPAVAQLLSGQLAGRTILAYNAPFDHERIAAEYRRHNIEHSDLCAPARWECIMRRRSQAAGTDRWIRLGGGHRALGDVRAAREIVLALAAGQSVL